MYYSAIGVIAVLILVIENHDILFRRSDGNERPSFKIFRRFLFAVLFYYAIDVLWGVLEAKKLGAALFVDTLFYFVAMAISELLWTHFAVAYLDENNIFGKFLVAAGRVLFGIVTAAVAVNIFVPVLFRVHTLTAEYSASPLRSAVLIAQIVLLLLVSVYAFGAMNRRTETAARKYRTIAWFGFITAVFLTIQIWFPYYPVYTVAYMLGTCVLRTFIVNDEKAEYKLRLEEATEREKLRDEELRNARRLAYKDALTGVKSKLAYTEAEEKRDEEIRLGRSPDFALAVFDVNGLKEMNDRYGHEQGDRLLVEACRSICVNFKHSPVFRVGGDEFAALLERSDYENRAELAQSFDLTMEQAKRDGLPVVAMGMADYEPSGDACLNDVFVRADRQMYEKKREMKDG